jgi:hypothetical protein
MRLEVHPVLTMKEICQSSMPIKLRTPKLWAMKGTPLLHGNPPSAAGWTSGPCGDSWVTHHERASSASLQPPYCSTLLLPPCCATVTTLI